jgi:hypothetical protein
MRRRLKLALLLLALPAASAQETPPPFVLDLPRGVVDITGWETISGEFETATARGTYRFHVNPRRQALYQVMRYRIDLFDPAPGLQRRRRPSERLAFVARPGTREPLRCWERKPAGSIPAWRELTAGTAEYQLEMALLMQVLAVHRAVRADER